MLAAPASLACKGKCTLRTQATTGQPQQPAFPAQWFYGLYVISSVRRALWPPSPACFVTRKLDSSVGESGPHDFAVRVARFVVRAFASIASRTPRLVTIGRNAPLARRDGAKIRMICASEKAKYFRGDLLKRTIILRRRAKSVLARRRFSGADG
jgi:hypothetical protein